MMTEPPPDVRWQALLVGVASSAHGDNPGFVQSLNSQGELARALWRNMPGLDDDNDLVVLPEPRHAHEVTDAIARLNEAHDKAGEAGLARPGLLFYYCGHGMNTDERLYLSMVETIDSETNRRRTGLPLSVVLDTIGATCFKRPGTILILDCCFAGLACEESAARPVHLLMAVGPTVLATHDPDSTGPTHFTGALVGLLRTGDPGAGPWLDLDTVHKRLEPQLVKHHGEDRRPYQRPVGESGSIVLGRNRAYSAQAGGTGR
jgi:hypothetical protein